MALKVSKLDLQGTMTAGRIVADMTFDNFDQSIRFIDLLVEFIQREKALAKASDTPEAASGEHEASQQGEVQGRAHSESGPNGEHHEQADTGSVT